MKISTYRFSVEDGSSIGTSSSENGSQCTNDSTVLSISTSLFLIILISCYSPTWSKFLRICCWFWECFLESIYKLPNIQSPDSIRKIQAFQICSLPGARIKFWIMNFYLKLEISKFWFFPSRFSNFEDVALNLLSTCGKEQNSAAIQEVSSIALFFLIILISPSQSSLCFFVFFCPCPKELRYMSKRQCNIFPAV